jgi:hypothetical protein
MYSMTGLNSDPVLPNRSDPWEARVDPAPEDGSHYGHSRVESTASDTAMFDNPFNDPTREVAPAGPLERSTHNQYDEFRDPYYIGVNGQH